MHSSILRGSDFEFTENGTPVTHEAFFDSFTLSDRLGIVTTHPLDGLGAATLVMSHVTAFYDRNRESGDDFFAYPDFFSFQRQLPLVQYGMFDIWPEEKTVHMPENTWDALSMIASRAVTILLIPSCTASAMEQPREPRNRARLESFRRSVHTCYAYAPGGIVDGGEIVVRSASESIRQWGASILDKTEGDQGGHEQYWNEYDGETMTQSFKRISVDDALCFLLQP